MIGARPARVARPARIISAPPVAKIGGCLLCRRPLTALAPRAIGRITVPTSAAKTNVRPTICRGRRRPLAKYAGSITDTQHGASRATIPAMNEVSTIPELSSCTAPPSSTVTHLL